MQSTILTTLTILVCAQMLGAAEPTTAISPGKVVLDPPTLHCLGLRWFFEGDSDGDAAVAVSYRSSQDNTWRSALPLRRVDIAAMDEPRPAAGQGIFAGSILFLEPDTEYTIRLELTDPDGGTKTEELRQRTWSEPVTPKPKRVLHVTPGTGGGTGTPTDPLRGLTEASAQAQAGDCLLLHAGRYNEKLSLNRSGTAEDPIVWRPAGDGPAILVGPSDGAAVAGYGKAHHIFDGLHITAARHGFHLNGSRFITIRNCRLSEVGTGIFGDGGEERFFIADNHITGRQPYPVPKGYKPAGEYRGIELSGNGSVICHNTIQGFRDGIDVREKGPVFAIDIHHNDIANVSDDGIELDFSSHNTRAYCNRITNAQMGISFQPIKGGPVYAIRNVLYNIRHETFKLHLSPTNKSAPDWRVGPHRTSGGIIIHNTVVKDGPPLRVWSDEGPVHHFLILNNLFVGTGNRAIDISCPMNGCILDANVYVAAEGGFSRFSGWNQKNYTSIADFRQAGQEHSGVLATSLEGIFVDPITIPAEMLAYPAPSLHIARGSAAVDRGLTLPGLNDGFSGKAPDAGAYELGEEVPVYGVRESSPEK